MPVLSSNEVSAVRNSKIVSRRLQQTQLVFLEHNHIKKEVQMITNPLQTRAYDAVSGAPSFAVDPTKIGVEPALSSCQGQ
jgi:hypothetical protein